MKTAENLALFNYKYIDNRADKTLFLFHGTGGDENDFLFLDDALNKKYNLLGLRGNVTENGFLRFFKRVALNIFDQESIKAETAKLTLFLKAWRSSHNNSSEKMYFLGYSNGANMLLATILLYPYSMKNLFLLHPMMPFEEPEAVSDLSSCHVFISSGNYDELIPPQESDKVALTLKKMKATVHEKKYDAGHEIGTSELRDVLSALNEYN